jgi:hypothetical protein
MTMSNDGPNLERLTGMEVSELLHGTGVNAELDIDPASDLLSMLELLIPKVLRDEHPEWETESIDGFFLASAVKSTDRSMSMIGTCILISDQAVTPFALELRLAGDDIVRFLRIRLGEPGGGPLGISGPPSNSRGATELLASLPARVDELAWTYDETIRYDPS